MFPYYSKIVWDQFLVVKIHGSSYVKKFIHRFSEINPFEPKFVKNIVSITYDDFVATVDKKLFPENMKNEIVNQIEVFFDETNVATCNQPDYILHGIISISLTWNLAGCVSTNPLLNQLLFGLAHQTRQEDFRFIHFNNLFLFTSMSLKIWKRILGGEKVHRVQFFSYFSTNFEKICSHLHLTDYMDFLVRQKQEPPTYDNLMHWNAKCETMKSYELPLIPKSRSTVKYVTGTACVGKSSLLKVLSDNHGWEIWSRGKLGTFAGKAKNALQIASLHLAIDNVTSRCNVIGDRGTIDNPIWTIFMDIFESAQQQNSSKEAVLYRFFELLNNFNEPCLSQLASQNVVIIIDNNCWANKQRMKNRNVGNDSHRSSIDSYVWVQNLGYFVLSKFFPNWKLKCVPYADVKSINFDEYSTFYQEVNEYFDSVSNDGEKKITEIICSKVNPGLLPKNEYSQMIGIYK